MGLASTALAGTNTIGNLGTNLISGIQTNGGTNIQITTNFEQRFLQQASKGNLQEIMLGQLAETNSADTNVQSFGALLVMDHSAAQQQLQLIATNLGITLPSTNVHTQAIVNQFSSLTGTQFDQAFIPFMIRDHIRDIQRYEGAALRAPDTSVRDYARTNLPVLMDHLVVAITLRESLLGNSAALAGITGTNGILSSVLPGGGASTGTNAATTGTGATGTGTNSPSGM